VGAPTATPPRTAAPAFAMSDVAVGFGGIQALDGVSLEVAEHQVLGVIGPNGAGKTTLFNVACGFVRPDTGTLHWQGRDLTGLRPHRLAGLGISRTLQGLGLFDKMTVLENVMIGADRHARAGFVSGLLGLPRSGREERALRERATGVLAELGVEQYAGRVPTSLPYPIRKRVALARALITEPRLLLLDEPASGLSNDEMDELAELIGQLTDKMSVMLVEHHMDLVMSVCHELVVLDFGKVIARGGPDEVREDPAVLAAYLGDDVGERSPAQSSPAQSTQAQGGGRNARGA
jgi:branched-chain amino acid transport system ATP-binding protein